MSSRYRQSTGAPTPGRSARNGTATATPARNAALRAGTAGAGAASQRAGELPPYQPLAHPLKPSYLLELSRLSHPQNFRDLTKRVGDIIACLSDVAAEVNEAVGAREDALKKERQKLASSQDQDGNTQQRIDQMERELEEMKDMVDKTTQQLDRDVRKMIDAEVHIADMQSTMKDLSNEVSVASTQQTQQTQRSQRRRRDEDEEEEYPDFEPTDPTNAMTQSTQRPIAPSAAFRDRLERARDRYQNKSLVDRYSHNNDYRAFKTVVHDSTNRDSDKTLPPEHLWFTESGTAAPGITAAGEDSDDDIQISKATISTKCPLTLQEFRDPVTSRKCPHSFEREAIMSMIENPQNTIRVGGSAARGARDGQRAVQCPVPGCQSVLSTADLHSDAVLKRKIARIQKANRAAEESDDEEEGGRGRPQSIGSGDDSDMDVDEDPVRKYKTERISGRTPAPSQSQRGRGRATVLELDDEDEDDD